MKVTGLFLEVLGGETKNPPPIWMMRQAGRYLPEYRATRAEAGSFLDLCATPRLAAEVTLQPIRRFDFDAAIIFSDILVVVMALGHGVRFDEGPKLEPLTTADTLDSNPQNWTKAFAPVYEALGLVRGNLEPSKALLGFAGAPWTLATYLAGGGNDEQKNAKLWAYRDPQGFGRLIDLLSACVATHLTGQIKAGADAVQIFDSWAAGLPPDLFERWVVQPTADVVRRVREAIPSARIIGFPRGASQSGLEHYAQATGVNAISLDGSVSLDWAAGKLETVLQGNLDPLALVAGGEALRRGVAGILQATRTVPFIFNLGHGILPPTPIEHVHELVKLVRAAA
jgi:uroporphyrinogen decarboxylase